MRQTNTKKNKRQKRALKFKFKVNDCKQFQKVMARLSRKQQQDKRELLSSLNHMNNCNSKHAAENRKFVFFYPKIIHSIACSRKRIICREI